MGQKNLPGELKRAELPNGTQLPFLEQGNTSGVPVVLLHGFAGSWRSFRLVLPHLPAWMHVFAVTQRGHGDASRPTEGYRLSDFAADIHAFIDLLVPGAAVIAGHSMGSAVALRLAANHPEPILGLVLVGACANGSRKADLQAFWDTTVSKLTDPMDPAFVRGFLQSTLAGNVSQAFFEQTLRESLKVQANVWKEAFRSRLEEDLSAELGKIRAPTLIVWGDQDARCPESEQETLVEGIRDLHIAYERRGAGPPLVLLHGAVSDSRWWRRQIDDLSDELTVVAWDAPGCGRSSDPPEDFQLSDYADCLADLILRIGLNKPHLLGLSFGGGLALEFYHRYPDVPATLVLASAYAGWAGSLSPEAVEERRRKGLRDSNLPPEQVVESWISTVISESASPEIIAEAKAIMREFHPAGMRAMLSAFAEADLSGMLSTVEVPTLLLYGELDQRSPLTVARSLEAGIPDSKLVVLPGVGHGSNLEAPEAFNSAVRSFLLSNREGRGT